MAMQRSVRHLRLRGPSEVAVRRAAIRLEDALRTASLPDAGARIVLVRRLALGTIDADAAPAMLARAWERVMTRSNWRCVHGANAHAGSAQAVWFADALDAHVALALRLLRGPPAHEWFWPMAVPGWNPACSTRTGLRAIVQSLLAREEAASAVPAWCARLARGGQASCLPDVFADGDLPVLQRLFAQAPHVAAALELDRPVAPVPAGDAAPDVRARSVHIAAALLTAGGEPGWAARLSQEQLQADPHTADPHAVVAADRRQGRMRGRPPGTAIGQAAARTSGPDAASANDFAAPARALRDPPSADAPASTRHAGNTEAPEIQPDWSDMAGEATAAGGIAFLLPVLQRLGYPDWLRVHPAWARHAVLQRVLASVLMRLDIADDDPAWAVTTHGQRPSPCRSGLSRDPPDPEPASGQMGPPPRPRAHLPRSFVAPPQWHASVLRGDGLREHRTMRGGEITDASGRLPLAVWNGARPNGLPPASVSAGPRPNEPAQRSLLDAVAAAWTTAAHRWLRRHARVGFHDLVRRPARLALTATHLDLHFDPAQADLRLRRHGLDLDPGWLPWFGRVVAFHYESHRCGGAT